MENLAATKVSKIVAQNYQTAKVFTAHGIDFCCNGGIPLMQACAQQQVDVDTVLEEVREALKAPETENFSEMPMDELAGYIEKTHHAYVRSTVPALMTYLEKIARVHGERHPELLDVRDLFSASAAELTQHMAKEEQILFPYLQAMVASLKSGYSLSEPHFGHVKHPIEMMETEHEQEGSRFKEIAALTDHYTPPKDACQTHRVAFSMLQAFEEDLHKHIHLENNILFPTAIRTFEKLRA